MEHYAGIDVSLEQSSVCVVDGTGRIVREARVASEPEALVRFLGQLGLVVTRIGVEAGPLSQWLHAGLTQAGLEVVLLETRQVKAALSAMVVKTDRKDARGIAQLLRMGWYRPVHCKSPPAQEVRALLVGRKLLQSKLLDVELSIRVDVEFLPIPELSQKIQTRATDFFSFGYAESFDSISPFMNRYRSDAEFAGTGYADPEVDALIDQIDGEMVSYVRDSLVEQVWRKVLGDIVYVPLYRPIRAWGLRADLDLPISVMLGGRPEFRDARYTTPPAN